MRTTSSLRAGLLASSLLLASCSGGGGSPGGGGSGRLPNAVYTIPGPYSQVYTPNGGTAFTMTNVQITYITDPLMPGGDPYGNLQIDITFAQDITNALPAPGTSLQGANQLGVYIGFDSDNNQLTGFRGIGCENFSGQTSTGDDAFLDVGTYYGRLKDGSYSVVYSNNIQEGTAALATTSVSGSVLTFVIPLYALGLFTKLPNIGFFVDALNGSDISYSGNAAIGQCAPASGQFVTR